MKKGYTLTEVLVCIALLGIVLNFIFEIYYQNENIIRKGKKYSESLVDVINFKKDFQKDLKSGEILRIDNNENEKLFMIKNDKNEIIYFYKDGYLEKKIGNNTNRRWEFSTFDFKVEDNFVFVYLNPFSSKNKFSKNDNFFFLIGIKNEK